MNLDQRLADAARHVSEQVDPPELDLDAVRTRAHARRRRTLATTAAAAVLTLGLAGFSLLTAGRDTTAPRPAAPPTSHIIRTLPFASCAVDGCLKPRVYGIPLGVDASGRRLRAKVTIPVQGWESDGDLHWLSRWDGHGTAVLSVYQPFEIAGPPACSETGLRKVAPDATPDEVVGLLATLPQFTVVDGPRALTAFGRDTRFLQVRTDRLTCGGMAGDRYPMGSIYFGPGVNDGGGAQIDLGRQVEIQFWVLALEGKPVVVEARQEGDPARATILDLDQIRSSLTFGIRQ